MKSVEVGWSKLENRHQHCATFTATLLESSWLDLRTEEAGASGEEKQTPWSHCSAVFLIVWHFLFVLFALLVLLNVVVDTLEQV